MAKTLIGIIGCGNISDAYFKGAARSSLVQVKACADLNPEAAKAKAAARSNVCSPARETHRCRGRPTWPGWCVAGPTRWH